MTPVRRGDIFWVNEPHPDARPSTGVPHPHVVVQEDVFNRSRLDRVIMCALTSNLHRAQEPGNVLLEEHEGGLARRSVVIVSQISSVPRERLGAHIGRLQETRVVQVLSGLRFQQRAFVDR